MLEVNYNLIVSTWSVSSDSEPRTEFIFLEICQSIASLIDSCLISVYASPAPQSELLEQTTSLATGSLGLGGGQSTTRSVQIRGSPINIGDPITVELTAGNQSGKVITATVQSLHASLEQTHIVGVTGMQKLAHARLNQVYENQTLSQIVTDLAYQVGVTTGTVETGNTYPYFIVHDAKSVFTHIQDLAQREGLDFYFDTNNHLTLQQFNKLSPDHIFRYGLEILDLQLVNHQPISDHIRIDGESPASHQGTDTWPWLVKDPQPCQGEAGQGSQGLSYSDGAVRTKDAADRFAAAKLGAIQSQATQGRLKILGNPTLKLGDAIEIQNAPKPELNGLFKVISVRHRFNKQEGFLTWVGFTGQGGNGVAALSGSLTGGLGL